MGERGDLARRVRYWRRKAGLPQWRLAEILGVNQSAISGWEKGRGPSMKSLRALCGALGISLEVFFGPLDEDDAAAAAGGDDDDDGGGGMSAASESAA
jgi:transcriptional regulator with XRE-family HTH domain